MAYLDFYRNAFLDGFKGVLMVVSMASKGVPFFVGCIFEDVLRYGFSRG